MKTLKRLLESNHPTPDKDEIDDHEYKHVEGKPHHSVETGVSDGSEPSHLDIHYRKHPKTGKVTHTYVSTRGEDQNAAPYRFKGKVSPKNVKAEYHHNMKQGM